MSRPQPTPHAAELLRHVDWIRGLARELVRDPGRADDVAQEAWLSAIRGIQSQGGPELGPHADAPPRRVRAWLGRIVRNEVKSVQRSEGRRRVREEAVARPEGQESVGRLVERASRHREVVGLVLGLEEPFRSTVLLRYFEDLTPPAIAARLGVPLKTVHSRLARAHDRMRVKLDGDYQDPWRWRAALVPLTAASPALPVSLPSTALLMTAQAKWCLACLLVLLGGFGFWQLASAPASEALKEGEGQQAASVVDPGAAPNQRVVELRDESDSGRVQTVGSAAPAPPEVGAPQAAAEPAVKCTVLGRVVDLRGDGVAGVKVEYSLGAESLVAVTSDRGQFSFRVEDPREPAANVTRGQAWGPDIRVKEDGWVGLRRARVSTTSLDKEHLVVVARTQAIQGHVVDESGVGLAQAKVSLSPRSDAYFHFPFPLDVTIPEVFEASTDGEGQFAMTGFPDAQGLWLNVSAEGYRTRNVALDGAPRPLLLDLQKKGVGSDRVVQGLVLDPGGRPVAGAAVQISSYKTTSGPDGAFALEFGAVAETTPICASAPGHLPALIEDFGSLIDRADGQPQPVELILGGAPLSIRGRVLRGDGAPCAGWRVTVLDEQAISQWFVPATSAESLARGAGGAVGRIVTDQEGRFSIDGLYPRAYSVQAIDPVDLLRVHGQVMAGDEGAVLRVVEELCGPIEGRIVDRRGKPRADVRVSLSRTEVSFDVGFTSVTGRPVITGADGMFSFESAPVDGARLSLSGEDIIYSSYEFDGRPDLRSHVPVVTLRCHFRIELSDASFADEAQVFGADGGSLQISKYQPGGMSAASSTRLVEGRSETVTVSELGSIVVLLKGGEEVARHSVAFDPEEVTVFGF